LRAIQSITNKDGIDSISLLWLPGYIRLRVWQHGRFSDYRVNEDGHVVNEADGKAGIDEPKPNNAGY